MLYITTLEFRGILKLFLRLEMTPLGCSSSDIAIAQVSIKQKGSSMCISAKTEICQFVHIIIHNIISQA